MHLNFRGDRTGLRNYLATHTPMDKQERNKISARITAMTNEALDEYIDDVTEDMTLTQLDHVAWYLGVRAEQLHREKDEENAPDYEAEKKEFFTTHQGNNMENSNV